MSFLNNLDRHEDEKRNLAFQTVVGIRDAVSLAAKKQHPPTYEQALTIIHDLDADLYTDISNLISAKNDNDIVKYYREEAHLQSITQDREIKPENLISDEIDRLNDLLRLAKLPKEEMRFVERRIGSLYLGLENLKPRNLSENRILNRDYSKVDRSNYFAEKYFENDFFIDYELPNKKTLRLRLLHPDSPEHITGADLIYEQYDRLTDKVRFIFLQYKTWDNGVIYFSQHENLKPQLNKMKCSLCDKGFCNKPEKIEIIEKFRFPYCCGFLRPTDKLQTCDSKMISSGLYVPVCSIIEMAENTKKLEKNILKRNTLNNLHFEELFNQNIIGSRWLDIEEVDDFYKEKEIIQNKDSIKIFARELIE